MGWEGTQIGGDMSWIKTTSDGRSPHALRAGRPKSPASFPCFPYFTSGCFQTTLMPSLQTCYPFSSRYILQSTCCKIMPLWSKAEPSVWSGALATQDNSSYWAFKNWVFKRQPGQAALVNTEFLRRGPADTRAGWSLEMLLACVL